MKYVTFLFGLVLLASCTKKDGDKLETAKSGTTEIKAIESSEPRYEGQFWSFSSEPVLEIGDEEKNDNYRFYRSFDAIQLSDGRIMVSNSGTHEIRIYDKEGTFLKSFGREGKGPGEFGSWSSMRIYRMGPDSISISDSGNKRINVFNVEGDLGRTINIRPIKGAGNPSMSDIFSDNSWLIWTTVGSAVLNGTPGSIIEKDYGFYRLDSNNNYSSLLFSIPARPRYVNQTGGVTNYPFIPLTPEPQYLTDTNNGILYSSGKKAEIIVLDSTGSRTKIFRWKVPQQPVSEIWNRYKKHFLSSFDSEKRRKQYRHFYDQDLPLPEMTPALATIKIDRLGYIWAQRYKLPWEDKLQWDVLEPSGRWLGTLELPPGLRITDIGEDYLLGYRYKEGVQHIVKYSLNRMTER